MTQILDRIRDVDPNDADASKETVVAFFQSLLKNAGTDSKKWLSALYLVVNRFPRFCMSHRSNAENYLMTFLDSKSPHYVIEAARVLHALQQVRPSQEKSATPKSCWREQMNVLCSAAHKLMGVIFSKSVDIYQHKETSKVELQSLAHSQFAKALLNTQVENSKKDGNKISVLLNRLNNVFIFMQAMLVEVYPTAKPVRPQTILDVLVRALSITSGNKNQDNQNMKDIATVKIQALRSLDALVACMGSNLLPFSALVIKLAMQTLRWTTENPQEEYKTVRCAAYATVSRWLITLRSDPDDQGKWHEELITNIVADTSTKAHSQITINTQPSLKNLSKKARRKIQNTMLQQSAIANHIPTEKNKTSSVPEINDPVSKAALECGESFLTVCGLFLKPEIHKQLQNHIVLELSRSPHTYGLLRVLEASRKSCVRVPPPTQYCLALYAKYVTSSDDKISKFSIEALQNMRLHLHGAPPSLSFAIDISKEDTAPKEKHSIVSERNKAALEALLGSNKVTVNNHKKQIIHLDDPPAKKIRLDENITDRISLSSDSNKSIEISDASDEEDVQTQVVDAIIENNEEDEHVDVEPVSEENTENNDIEINEVDTNDSASVMETITNDIFDARTQYPFNASNDTVDGEEMPLSMEVAYDLPNIGKEKVPVLERMEDDNLPSTNDTDDVPITCGQLVKVTSEDENEKKDDAEKDTAPKVNGIVTSAEQETKIAENSETVKVHEGKEVSVEDMLADFCDEVNEESNV